MLEDIATASEATCPECARRMRIYSATTWLDEDVDLPIIYACPACDVVVTATDYYNDHNDCGA